MTGIPRVQTGIAGLDSMFFGGVPEHNQVLVTGGPGAGKTLLSFNVLYNCAKAGIPAAFITFEEQPEAVIKNAKETFHDFADIDALISSKKLVVDGTASALRIVSDEASPYSFGNIVSDIEGIIRSNNAKVVAIDSISLLKLMIGDPFTYYKSMIALVSNLKRLEVTSLLTTELYSTERSRLKFSPEHFIFDGILALYQGGEEDKRVLTMEVLKMRGSNHSLALAPYEITPQGFRVFTIEQ